MSEVVMRAAALTKTFDDVTAVDTLDVTVRRGEVYGFLGRNGAGKTTTIRALLGLIAVDAGSIEILGEPMWPGRTDVFSRIGAVLESPGAYQRLSVRENLSMRSRLLGLRGSSHVSTVLETLGMADLADRPAGSLSSGNRQRLAIAASLLHQPEILILDEPTTALDPAIIHELRLLLRHLSKERGVTIFMSTHVLGEVEQLADRIGIIDRGRLVEEVDYDEIRRRARDYLEFRVSDTGRAAWILEERLGITDFRVLPDSTVRIFQSLHEPEVINAAFVNGGVAVGRLVLAAQGLEEHFLSLTSGGGAR